MLFGTIENMRPDRAPDFLIGPEGDPYMERWYLVPRNPEFNIYYHRILHDDDDRALHNHPWPSFSICCAGQMEEIIEDGEGGHQSRIVNVGDTVFREPDLFHRLKLIDGVPCETLFITGARVQEWGFNCPKGFVDWRIFTDFENTGTVGAGCGELS